MKPFFVNFCHALGALTGLLLGTSCVRQRFFQPDARPTTATPLPATADSVRGATAGRQYARHGRLHRALVGRHHRPTWAAPVTVPVLRLATVQPNGLRPNKVGGGFNSTSLTLLATQGPAFVLRTVDKDPIRAAPQWLRGTFLINALRDNISSTNPYAALVVPPLAEAVGVPHANPRLFYVPPPDPAFQGDSLRLFRGQLAYLEEKSATLAGKLAPAPSLALSSTEAFATIFEKPEAQIDQLALLRARLLDGWLGDWDRHPGQWSWTFSKAPQGTESRLTPLPKDRDMVFYRLDDGVLGWLIGHLAQPHWVSFGPRFSHVPSLLSSGHYLDVRALNSLTRKQFLAAATAMQQHLPDTLIERAVRRLPPAAFALEGRRTIAALQARRAELPALADAFYLQLARRPRIGGTAQPERFEIHRYADSTIVAVYAPQAAGNKAGWYRRTFLSSETKLIQIEGLAGDDIFVVEEHSLKPSGRPKIHIYGGPGHDELRGKVNSPGIRFEQANVSAKRAFDKPPKE